MTVNCPSFFYRLRRYSQMNGADAQGQCEDGKYGINALGYAAWLRVQQEIAAEKETKE